MKMTKRTFCAAVLTLCLAAAAWGAMRDDYFAELCKDGSVAEIRAELLKGANVNAKGEGGYTALMWAARRNPNPGVVPLLLQAGADVNVKNWWNGLTALMWSVNSNKNPEVVPALLKAGANVNVRDDDGTTLLKWAAGGGTPEVISLLLGAGAGVDVNVKNRVGETALMSAARNFRHPDVIPLLLKAGADINARDNKGQTALDVAREWGNTDAVNLLLEASGATSDSESQYQLGLKYAAGDGVEADQQKAVELFRQAAAQGHAKAKEALKLFEPEGLASGAMSDEDFVELCEDGSVAQIQAELAKGANANAENMNGYTALIWAAAANTPEVISLLLEAGADVNAITDGFGITALMRATAGNTPEVVSLLLKAGANVNAKDEDGWTALMAAIRNKNPEVISLLLKAGADVNARNNEGETALDYAREQGNAEAIKLLEAAKGKR